MNPSDSSTNRLLQLRQLHQPIVPSHEIGLDPNELVLMYTGEFKAVKDLLIGDLLMGDDSTPRRVLTISSGTEDMYRIVPINGEPYVVSGDHTLAIRCTANPQISKRYDSRYEIKWLEQGAWCFKRFIFSSYASAEEAYQKAQEYASTIQSKNKVYEITLDDYLAKTSSWTAYYKGYRSGIEFPTQSVPMNPYLLGYWLGDGTSIRPEITTVEPEVIEYFTQQLPGLELLQRSRNGEAGITYYIKSMENKGVGSNYFLNQLRELNVLNNKHIPESYKRNSREIRLAVLAGLIDSDGHLHGNCYEIIQKNKHLADDITYLCRSLGFSCCQSLAQKTCTNSTNGRVTGTYYRCSITGAGLEEIPVLLMRKKAHVRRQIKDALNFGFTVEYLGNGPCCGFELDGNNRFILKDFTVTG